MEKSSQSVHSAAISDSSTLASETSAAFAKARQLAQLGRYQQAVIEYRKIMDSGVSVSQRKQAQLGAARNLIKMKQYTAALASLAPLPSYIEDDYDRQILAVAAQAMLFLNRTEDAETLLEISIGTDEQLFSPAVWYADACGNLGYSYLKNNKPAKAEVLYRKSARLYIQLGNYNAGQKATRQADDIRIFLQPSSDR